MGIKKPKPNQDSQLSVTDQLTTEPTPATPEPPAPDQSTTPDDVGVFQDLTDVISKRPRPDGPVRGHDDPHTEEATVEELEPETDIQDDPFDFNERASQIENDIQDTLQDSEKLSELLVKGYDILRTFFWPWAYRKTMFTEPERDKHIPELRQMLTDKEAEISDKQRELMTRIIDYKDCVQSVPLSDEEIRWLSTYLAPHIDQLPASDWLMQNSWVVAILVIESKRATPMITSGLTKTIDNIANKQGGSI